jgi:ligand-binding sensor domain-containing protein
MRINLILIVLCFYFSQISGQIVNWENLTCGKEINVITDLGSNLWIGTQGGLVRINKEDGQTFFFNVANSSLTSNMIINLSPDSAGQLVIQTDKAGILKFDNQENWIFDDSVNFNFTSDSQAIDDQSNLWVAMANQGLAKYDGQEWTYYDSLNSSMPCQWVTCVAADNQGYVWAGTRKGLLKFDKKDTWQTYIPQKEGKDFNYITAVHIDNQGQIWAGAAQCKPPSADGGLFKFDGMDSWQFVNTSNSGLPTNMVNGVALDRLGSLWAGTDFGLAHRDDRGDWTHFLTVNSGLHYDYITSLDMDVDDNLWIGTYYGLQEFNGKSSWQVYDYHNSSLPSTNIQRVNVDWHNNVWIRPSGGALVMYDNASTWEIFTDLYPDTNWYGPAIVDREGQVWSWSPGRGIARFNGAQWTVYDTTNSDLPVHDVIYMTVDRGNRIWMNTMENGLFVFNGNGLWQDTHIPKDQLPPYRIRSLMVGQDNSLWIGTLGGGLFRGQVEDPIRISDAGEANSRPKAVLFENAPNPFNPSTIISFCLPELLNVSLSVFDVTGKRVAVIVDRKNLSGLNRVSFNACHLASGVYYYQLKAGDYLLTRRMVLSK